ncbi:MAG: lycopene cyclase domain-containing protein, partial [Thermus sp.]
MTYLQFHLTFLLPPLLILLLLARPRPPRLWAYLLMPLIALVYTTPWDNYLVWKGVWGYPEGRVLLRIGYVPLEEYLFFLLQPLLTGALLLPEAHVVPALREAKERRALSIEDLRDAYSVSYETAAHRFTNL